MLTDEQRRALVEALENDGVVFSGPVWELKLTEYSRLLAAEIKAHEETRRQLDECREVLRDASVWLAELNGVTGWPGVTGRGAEFEALTEKVAAVLGGGK